MKVKKSIIPAAGLGTRFLPVTKPIVYKRCEAVYGYFEKTRFDVGDKCGSIRRPSKLRSNAMKLRSYLLDFLSTLLSKESLKSTD